MSSPARSLFAAVEMAPRDPILGLSEQFNADPNPAKVNLGVGVYYDENGKLPLLQCVQAAEKMMVEAPKARGYLPIDGIAAYDKAVQGLVFGAESEPVRSGRVATVQAVGGTGGLKIGADFLQRLNAKAKVLISDPSWENLRALYTVKRAGRLDVGERLAQVLIVGQRLLDKGLQPRVAEDIAIAQARQRRLALPKIGIALRPARRRSRCRSCIMRIHAAGAERAQGQKGRKALHAGCPSVDSPRSIGDSP